MLLTPAQMRVFDALLAPYRGPGIPAGPPTDTDLAGLPSISPQTAKAHLREIYGAYGPASSDTDHKRRRLVERALRHPVRPLPRRRVRRR